MAQVQQSNIVETRGAQMFPSLGVADIARVARFGRFRRYSQGEWVVRAGEAGMGMILILSGEITVSQRDSLGHVTPIHRHGPGCFLGEVGQLSGRPSFIDALAANGDLVTELHSGEVIGEMSLLAQHRLRKPRLALAELAARTFYETFAKDNTPEDMATHAAESYGPEIQGREIADPNILTTLLDVEGELVAFSQLRRGPAPEARLLYEEIAEG